MHPYGGDRFRTVGEKFILHARISKGWTARVAKTNTTAEYPGTAVLWDNEYFEVVAAELLPQGGVRYVLEAWRDDHVIRVFDSYDEATEARRLEDFRAASVQRKKSVGARFMGILLGHFPSHVQKHLEHEYGVTPARMTILSCLLPLALLGICVWLKADAALRKAESPVPVWVWFLALGMLVESAMRFLVAMSQNRGMGSLLGFIAYIPFWYLTPARQKWPKPWAEERGLSASFTIPPPDDVAIRDSLEVRGVWLTLLTPAEQLRLAERFGFDYRKHAYGLSWIILAGSVLGAVSSFVKVADSRSFSALISLIVAGALAIEQVLRLIAFKRGPAGSFLGVLVRPFMRDLLERG